MTATDLDLALELADIADSLSLRGFGGGVLETKEKADGSTVSSVDLEIERRLAAALSERCPGDTILGEEISRPTGAFRRRWIIDPIDHTANYVRKIPFFATMIALEVAGEIAVGVISAPALRCRWWASRGGGAFSDGRRAQVSSIGRLGDAYLSFAAIHVWQRRALAQNIVDLAGQCRFTYGSGGFWAHMMVAEGRLDASLDPWGEVWDIAALKVIVEEAGGRVTDLDDRSRVDGGCAIVTNGHLHETIISALRLASCTSDRAPGEK